MSSTCSSSSSSSTSTELNDTWKILIEKFDKDTNTIANDLIAYKTYITSAPKVNPRELELDDVVIDELFESIRRKLIIILYDAKALKDYKLNTRDPFVRDPFVRTPFVRTPFVW
jgi:hypothetical protein